MAEILRTRMLSTCSSSSRCNSGSSAPLVSGGNTIGIQRDTSAILLSIAPLSTVFPSVRPLESSIAVLQALVVFTVVIRTIRPDHSATALHLVVLPLPVVLPAVHKDVTTVTFHLAVPKLSHIGDTIVGVVRAEPMLHSTQELSSVAAAIGPRFGALSRLLVADPVALVDAPIRVGVLPAPVNAIAMPLPFVHVAAGRGELPITVCLPVHEGTFITLTIGFGQNAVSVTHGAPPLALVHGTVLHLTYLPLLQG
mmetsp:Transcript_28811/g.75933  ORF Transcript_28811/g.75933 Transcript_28811/m.75933 type:complete len:253 (+) Transcript_28811:358-1116(+)